MNLAVEIAGIRFKNPLIAASGTFGYGVEYEGVLDLSLLGGIVSKGLYMEPRDGAPTPRIVETPSGLLNAIGLQGVGIRAFVRDVLPRLAKHDTALLVNVCGDTVDEYAEVSRVCDGAPGIAGLEVNISCPNVKKGGMAFGGDPRMTHEVVAAVRKATRLPVIPKLSPNVGDITVFARAAEEAGRRRAVLHQHAPRPRDRRRDAPPEARLRHRRALRPGHPPGGRADGLAGRARGEDPGDRDRRHRRRAGRPRVPDRGLPRGPDRHRELRGPRDLRARPGRPRAPTSSGTGRTTSTPWWGRSSTRGSPGPATLEDANERPRSPDRGPRRAGGRRRPRSRGPAGGPRGPVQDRQPGLHRRRARPRPRDRGAGATRSSSTSSSTTSRTPSPARSRARRTWASRSWTSTAWAGGR